MSRDLAPVRHEDLGAPRASGDSSQNLGAQQRVPRIKAIPWMHGCQLSQRDTLKFTSALAGALGLGSIAAGTVAQCDPFIQQL